MEFRDKAAIITGGASGLGKQTATGLFKKGVKVALFDLQEELGKKTAAELGDGAMFQKVDVTDQAQVEAGVAAVAAAFGGVHILVNCAGVGFPAKVLGKDGPMDMAPWIKTIQINLIGAMQMIRAAAAQMARNQPEADGERGVIVNTASVAAYEGQIGQTAYAASKAGIVGLTLPTAREFAPLGIRVCTIAPGLFETPMLLGLPEKVQQALGQSVPFPSRLGKPEEYAHLVRHIVENPMLNGETIRLDGALRMAPR